MFRNMNALNLRNLCTDHRGSVAVEFVLISMVLLIFLMFLTDLVIRQATIGKLDRTSYSVAGVLRERIQLFDGREKLQQQDVNEAAKLAGRMLSDMHSGADLRGLQLRVEEVHFVDPIGLNDTRKQVKLYNSWTAGYGSGQCHPAESLDKQLQLAPRGSYGRWVPLYQVTVCLPAASWYTRLTSSEEKPLLSSFAIVMLR